MNLDNVDLDRFWMSSDVGPLNAGLSVRLLSPQGRYPREGFRHSDAAIIIRPELSVVITRFAGIMVPKDYYSEIAFASPFDVRVLGTLLLGWTANAGVPHFYPTTEYRAAPSDGIDLTDGPCLERLLDEFRSNLMSDQSRIPHHHRPPLLGGSPYNFMPDDAIDHSRVGGIFNAVDVNDALLIRGLGGLIQANMLACYLEFFEQACMSLWISLEASMHPIFRRLKASGTPKPTAYDAGVYLDDVFENQQPSEGYFTDFYSGRIRTVHPSSSYGVYHMAPLAADDFYELNEMLVPVYDFIVTGNVREEFKGH